MSKHVYEQVLQSFREDPETYVRNKNMIVVLKNPLFANALNNICSYFETYADQVVARIGILTLYDLASRSAQEQGSTIPSITSASIDALIPSLKDTDEWKRATSEDLGETYLERIRSENPFVAKTLEELIPTKDPENTGKNALFLGGLLTYFLISWQIDADNLKREIAL